MDGEDVGARNIMEGNQVGLFLFVVYPIHQNKRRRVVNWWSLPFHRRPRGNKKFTSVTYSWYSSSVSMTVGLPDELGGSFYKKLMHISLRIGWWQQIERTFEWKWLFMFICMSTYGRRETTGQVQRPKTNSDELTRRVDQQGNSNYLYLVSYSGALSCCGRIADMEDVNNSSVKLVVGLVAMLSYHYEWKGTQCSASGQWAQRNKLTLVTEKRKWWTGCTGLHFI